MLAILTSHPIQYQVPLWRELARRGDLPFEVWYLTDHSVRQSFDAEFQRTFSWDLDLLSGYPHRFLEVNPGADIQGGFQGVRFSRRLDGLLRERGVRALWVEGWRFLAFWQAVFAARRVEAEVWLRGESNDLAAPPPLRRWLKKAVLREVLFPRVTRFLCIGSANRRLYVGNGVEAERLASAPYSVDNARFRQQAASWRDQRESARAGWGIAPDAFCVLFAGKLIAKKRPGDLVRAAAGVRAAGGHGARLHLLFVGSGELGGELRGSCQVVHDAEDPASGSGGPASAENRPPASFAGFLNQNEMARAYAVADVLVLSSDTGETWGLVVNEAMASGRPAIVSDACGCGEDLAAAVDPVLRYPCGDIEALAGALRWTMEQTGDALAGRVRAVVDRFDLTKTAEAAGHLYARTTARAG